MKKFLSVILALITVFSLTVPAYAMYYEDSIVCGEKKIFDTTESWGAEFKHSNGGIFAAQCDFIKGQRAMIRIVNGDSWVYDADLGHINRSETLYFCAGKDSQIGIDCSDDAMYGVFSIEINELKTDTLKVGENNVTVGKEKSFFSFTPSKSGYYNFASVCDKDTEVEIIAEPDIDVKNDNSGLKNDKNFDSTLYLEAGKPALIIVSAKMLKGTVPCRINVTLNKNEKAQDLVMIFPEPMSKVIIKNWGMAFWLKSVPSGALAGKDVKITSSNEEIVSINGYNEIDGRVDYSSNDKAGSAVITVEADGFKKSVRIVVLPDVLGIFYTIPYFGLLLYTSVIGLLLGY